MTEVVFSRDLAGIEVGETQISEIRGEEGRLSYRGFLIESLADKPFWQVVWLLLFGTWPDKAQETALREYMGLQSRLTPGEMTLLHALPRGLHPMLMLQGVIPLLGPNDGPRLHGLEQPALDGLRIAAKLPTLIAAWRRLEQGREPLPANPDLGFHENFLLMLNGRAPDPEQVRVFGILQTLQMEHSYNASTFAGRVCASTLAPIQSSLAASIGTVHGVRHGCADELALEAAQQIISPSHAAAYVADAVKRQQPIPGIGDRDYKTVDPRARILKPLAKALCRSGEAKRIYDNLEAIEAACLAEYAKRDQRIAPNVEFYKSAVYHQLGIPGRYFTAVFAMARIYGFIAHFLEFNRETALIWPRARYRGQVV